MSSFFFHNNSEYNSYNSKEPRVYQNFQMEVKDILIKFG